MANVTDKSILTAAGKALLAQLNAEEKALVIDKMIFANVPNRPEYPQPDDVVPSSDVVHEAAVEQRGRLSVDSVIYSTTLTSQEGPFEFNWTGAYCSEYGVLVTIDHHALTPKTADEPGVSGNTLVRSIVLEYKDIAEITNITVDASTWQYNATPRMKKMDDDVAQANIDQNGKDWFIEDGFLVTPQASALNIKAGAGYVSGNRVMLEFDRNVQVPNKPSFIYVDAHREGTPTGEQVTLFDFVVTVDEKDDYTDANGVKHFVCKIAQVLADGSVSDLRPKSGSADKLWVGAEERKQTAMLSSQNLLVIEEGVYGQEASGIEAVQFNHKGNSQKSLWYAWDKPVGTVVGFTLHDDYGTATLKTTHNNIEMNFEFINQQVKGNRGQLFVYRDFTVDIRGWGASPDASPELNSLAITSAFAYLNSRGGGAVTSSLEKYDHVGVVITNPAKNLKIFGQGWEAHWHNVSEDGSHSLHFTGEDFDSPVKGIIVTDIQISGNPQSGDGLRFDKIGRFEKDANVSSVYRTWIHSHGGDGVQYGESVSSGAGNKLIVEASLIEKNLTGIRILGQSNIASITSNTISEHVEDGIYLNHVASTNVINKNFIVDNKRYGCYAFRCEQPIIIYNAFNRNLKGAVVLGGDPEGSASVKYTESALITGNLFGDNGGDAPVGERTEVSIRAARGTQVYCNYFYNTDKDRYVYISDYAEGYMIRSNWFKDFTLDDEHKKYVVKDGVVNSYGVFDDDINNTQQWTIYLTNKNIQYVIPRDSTLIQTKEDLSSKPSYRVKGDGTQEYGDGDNPPDVSTGRSSPGTYDIDGILRVMNTILIKKVSSIPTHRSDGPRVYATDATIGVVWPDGTNQVWLTKA